MSGNAANFPATANALGRIIQTTDGNYTETYNIPVAPGPYTHLLGANLTPALPSGWQDVPLGAYPINPPGAVTLGTPAGFNTLGGFLTANGVYKVAMTNVTDYGETVVGTVTTFTLGATFTAANYVLPAVSQGTADAPIRRRRLYRSAAGGSSLFLVAEISDLNQLSYVDGMADVFLLTAPPSTNGSGAIGTVVISGGGKANGYWQEVAPGTGLVGGQYIVDYSTGATGGTITHAAADAGVAAVQVQFTAGTLASATVVNNIIQAIQDAAAKMQADESTLTATQTTANAAIPTSLRNAINGVLGIDANGHLMHGYTGGAAPSVTPGAEAGTGATASLLSGSTDMAGTINVTIGTGPASSGTLVTLTFGTAYANTNYRVFIQASDGSNGVQFPVTVYKAAGSLTVYITNGGPVAGQNYHFDYLILA